jgi:redox-sensitive bicupin YhaK (pirin superfamily)
MKIRPASTRGVVINDWITSTRTFSNNSYYDPQYMSWGNLKVINDDVQQPGNMVPNHEHHNFDILGYLIEGELEHRDSLGNVNRARPGQIQHMWCGRSIWHTEASVGAVPARYLQIWIIPKDEHMMTDPYYEIIDKPIEQYGDIAVDLKQDFSISAGQLTGTQTLNISNRGYLYVISGSVSGTGWMLNEGDGAEIVGDLTADFAAHIILFKE